MLKDLKEDNYSKSTVFFPIVGVIIGGILAIFNTIISQFMPPMLSAIFLVVVWIFITGALHLDGFADTIDGFCASNDRAEILRVMSDTITGQKAVVAIVMLLLLKCTIIQSIEEDIKTAMFLLTPTISRYLMILTMKISKPARNDGLGKLFIGRIGCAEFIVASFITILLVCLISIFLPDKISGILAFGIAGIITWCFIHYSNRKIGGMTGDTLGAINEIAEVVILLVIFLVT